MNRPCCFLHMNGRCTIRHIGQRNKHGASQFILCISRLLNCEAADGKRKICQYCDRAVHHPCNGYSLIAAHNGRYHRPRAKEQEDKIFREQLLAGLIQHLEEVAMIV